MGYDYACIDNQGNFLRFIIEMVQCQYNKYTVVYC